MDMAVSTMTEFQRLVGLWANRNVFATKPGLVREETMKQVNSLQKNGRRASEEG